MENQDLKENVLLNLRSVTQSCKGGVPFERLQRDYKDLLGSPIPFRDLGYNSLEAFIRDIPDVISLRKNNEGQLMAMGVADATTAHIVSLVSRQKVDTRKRNFRKPMTFGKRSVSSRYTFRDGPRGSHSNTLPSHTSRRSPPHFARARSPPRFAHARSPPRAARPKSPPYSSRTKSPSRKVSSSTEPASVQHSRPNAPVEQVPSRKYEIAPRFLKLKEMQNGSSLQELISPTTYSSLPLNSTEEILPPRAIPRSLTKKPQPLENYRNSHLDVLESARSAKEYIDIYARANNLTPVYSTALFGQKTKYFAATLKLKDKSYQTYPDRNPTKELAEEKAAKMAMAEIKERKEDLKTLPETPYSNTDEIRILLNRIEEIIYEKPSGMFGKGIIREYEHKFNEKLPACWPELLKQSGILEIEELKVDYGKVPDGVNFIVHPIKESSSGNRTPSSTSSKTEYVYEDLDTKTLKKNLVTISLPTVPDFKIPNGNIWEVYITDVNDSVSAKLFDYYDDFLALAEEMSQFYKSKNFPVVEVFESQVYAACTDDTRNIWHRVAVDEIKDGLISCYFVDEGDTSTVRKENLQEMNQRFLNLPYQAIHLTLDGLEEYENCIRIDILEKYLLGQTLIAEVKRWYSNPDFFPELSGMHRTVYSVVLFDTSSGNDVNLNEFLKKTTIESLICKLPKLSTASCAYLSHVTSEGHVYLRLTNPQQCWIEQELERFSPDFEKASAATSKISHNTMCAAKYESGTWHRAIVSERLHASLDPEVVEVFFVDYGHVGVVGKSELCELEPISELLASAPHQAICCELSNALPSLKSRWTELATTRLLELAPFDQELIIRVVSEEDGTNLAKVNLYKRNQDSEIISINDSISCNLSLFHEERAHIPIKAPSVLPLRLNSRKNSLISNLSGVIPDVAVPAEEQMAKRLGTSLSSDKIEWLNTPDDIKSPEIEWLNTPDDIKSPDAFEIQSPVSLKLPTVPENEKLFDVFVTMASHPHNFVVQPLESSNELDQLMKDMKVFYEIEENLLEMDFSMLRKNEYYAALHSDGDWYRVRIEHITDGSPVLVAVHYVDFGDFNTVSIGRLQQLYQEFKKLPCQAIKASLFGVKPCDIDWDPLHCVKFQNMVKERPFVSVVKKQLVEMKDGIPSLHVELILIDTSTSKDLYINEVLVEKNIAKPQ